MSKETTGIVLLSITAVLLLIFNFTLQRSAEAATSVRDRDYHLVTARLQDGGEALYVTDNRTGVCAVFAFDPSTRTVTLRDAKPVAAAFR